MLTNKKVWLICAENFSWPMHYLAKELRSTVKEIRALFIQPGEAYFNSIDYRTFCQLNKDLNVYETSSICEQYIRLHNKINQNLDMRYIQEIEDKYTHFSGLNEQFLTEMTLTPYYHDRKYYKYIDQNKILLYAQLYYQYLEKLFKKDKPNFILDCDVDFFGRSALLEVSHYFNIKYISIDHSRIDGYIIPTDRLCKSISPKVKKYFENINSKDSSDDMMADYKQIINKMGFTPDHFKKMKEDQMFNIKKLFKRLIIQNLYFIKSFSLRKVKLNVIHNISSPIVSDTFLGLLGIYKYYLRRIYLEYFNVFKNVKLENINYLLVPLHVIPESSTTVLSPIYINELFIIESLSKSIKADQFVVVKEHWSMIGHRPISFYKRLKKLHNVILINPKQYDNPKEFITNSDLVVTRSGSTAVEALFLGVNSLVFSDVIYSLMDGIKKIVIDSNLSKIIEEHIKYKPSKQDQISYINTIKHIGEKVDLKPLLLRPEISDRSLVDANINALRMTFEKGIKYL